MFAVLGDVQVIGRKDIYYLYTRNEGISNSAKNYPRVYKCFIIPINLLGFEKTNKYWRTLREFTRDKPAKTNGQLTVNSTLHITRCLKIDAQEGDLVINHMLT